MCRNVELCAGLKAGIGGSLNAVCAIWPHSTGWTIDESNRVTEEGNEGNNVMLGTHPPNKHCLTQTLEHPKQQMTLGKIGALLRTPCALAMRPMPYLVRHCLTLTVCVID